MGKSYTAYIASLVLFGSNGILAAAISLPSHLIVVVRTLLGALLLGALFFVARGIKRSAANETAPKGRVGGYPSMGAASDPSAGSSASSKEHPVSGRLPRSLVALALFAASGAALGASWIALFEAYRLIGVGTASLLYYCGPVIVMGCAPLLFKERMTALKLGGFAAVAVGAACISLQSIDGGQSLHGVTLGLLSACLYAVMIVCTKKAACLDPAAQDQGLRNSFVQLLAGFGVAACWCLATQGDIGALPSLSASEVAALAVLGVVNTGIGCLLYFWSVGRLPVQTVAVCGYLEPLSAVVLSALVLGEPMGGVQIAGAALIVGGAAFCELSDRILSAQRERRPVSQAPSVSRYI